MTSTAPFASVRSIGFDPCPYLNTFTGERSSSPSYKTGIVYLPRSEFTHTPINPSDLLVGFREAWEQPGMSADYDLGEWAELTLRQFVEDGSRESRVFRRFLELCVSVLPRPLYEREVALGIVLAAA